MSEEKILKEIDAELESVKSQLKEAISEIKAVNAQCVDLKTENEALKKDAEEFSSSLKEAHEAIGDAEAQVVDAPVFNVTTTDEKGKKVTKKVKLIIAKSNYPKSRNNIIEITAEVLKKDQKLVDELYDIGFGGFEEINIKD